MRVTACSRAELLPFLREDARPPPEVKLPEGSEGRRHPARGEASRRKRRTPFLREEAEGRKQVQIAEGRAFCKTSSLPSESRQR